MKHTTNKLVISLVPTYTRILNAITTIVLLTTLITFYPEDGINPLLAIAIGLSLIFLCYEERWIFNPETEEVIFKNGLIFLAKKKKLAFSDVEELNCMEFEKGFRKTPFTRIVVIEKNGKETVLASIATEKHPQLIKQAEQLQTFFSEKKAN